MLFNKNFCIYQLFLCFFTFITSDLLAFKEPSTDETISTDFENSPISSPKPQARKPRSSKKIKVIKRKKRSMWEDFWKDLTDNEFNNPKPKKDKKGIKKKSIKNLTPRAEVIFMPPASSGGGSSPSQLSKETEPKEPREHLTPEEAIHYETLRDYKKIDDAKSTDPSDLKNKKVKDLLKWTVCLSSLGKPECYLLRPDLHPKGNILPNGEYRLYAKVIHGKNNQKLKMDINPHKDARTKNSKIKIKGHPISRQNYLLLLLKIVQRFQSQSF